MHALTLLLPSLYPVFGANRLRHCMAQRKSQTTPSSHEADASANPAPTSILRGGPAGWAYPDWAGYDYPSRRAKGFHEATYLAEFFDTIVINTSFYLPLSPALSAHIIDRVTARQCFS